MMKRLALGLAVAGGLLLGGFTFAYRTQQVVGQGAEALVRDAWTRGRNVALEGRQKVIVGGGGVGRPVELNARVLTSADGHTRIEYTSGPLKGVTIWENGERTYRFNPKARRLTVAQKRDSEEERRRQELQLLQNYRIRRTGEQTVAGRRCVVVDLHPKSGSDRWKRVAIDPISSVVLLNEDHQADRVLRQTEFTEVRYLDQQHLPKESDFHPPAELLQRYAEARPGDTSSRFDVETISRLLGFPVKKPRWVPRGYAFQGAYQTPCACSQPHQAARLEYSDGLNTLTIFECAHPACTAAGKCFGPSGTAPMAAHLQKGNATYLVLGEAHREDLNRVVESIP